MKNHLILTALSIGISASAVDHAVLCDGFVPKNDRYIPVATKSRDATPTGLSEEQFNSILDNIQKIYGPIVESRGGVLDIQRLWTDGTVNASAERIGTTYRLNMYGGMARHELMTPDGFMLVVCHEMGHHLGGAPKFTTFFGSPSWGSVEGQADYYGTSKCMKRMFAAFAPASFDEQPTLADNDYAVQTCASVYPNQVEQEDCVRDIGAGIVLGNVLNQLGGATTAVSLQTPSPVINKGVMQAHPPAQCRLDTYFEGATCKVPYAVDFSDTNTETGACTIANNDTTGVRSKCWFNPKASRSFDRRAQVSDRVDGPTSSEIFY